MSFNEVDDYGGFRFGWCQEISIAVACNGVVILDVKADNVSKRACGDRVDGRLFVTATKTMMLPFFSSAINYSALLVNLVSDLIIICTIQDLQTYSATLPPSLPTLSFCKSLYTERESMSGLR